MHGSLESGGVEWGGHSIAGEWIKIHHNTFHSAQPAVLIRGLPRKVCEVDHNWFFSNPADQSVGQVFGEKGNMQVHDNVVGEKQRPWAFPN